jgi:hypothetical protein
MMAVSSLQDSEASATAVAIREGIRIVLEENASLLVRNDRKWMRLLSHMDRIFKNAAPAKSDEAGKENLRFLNEMYKAMNKAENET